jgi:hypothetical protein
MTRSVALEQTGTCLTSARKGLTHSKLSTIDLINPLAAKAHRHTHTHTHTFVIFDAWDRASTTSPHVIMRPCFALFTCKVFACMLFAQESEGYLSKRLHTCDFTGLRVSSSNNALCRGENAGISFKVQSILPD